MSKVTNAEKSDRLSLRISPTAKARLEEAAAALSVSMSDFILAAAVREADEVLIRQHVLRLTDEDVELLEAALAGPPEPTEALVRACRLHRQQVEALTERNVERDDAQGAAQKLVSS